jgi:hypothetical protein
MTNSDSVCLATKRNRQENPRHKGTIADRCSSITPADMFTSNYITAWEAQKPKAQSTTSNALQKRVEFKSRLIAQTMVFLQKEK